jgi:hypothetical protein
MRQHMGGIVDPKTGEVLWEMHVPLDEQLAHYRAHPPRALAYLRATAIDVDWKFDGHGEPVNTTFTLACSCGATRFTVSSGFDEDGRPVSPVAIECAACNADWEVFDNAKHGYDAELGMGLASEPAGSDDLASDEVAPPHELVVRFEYPSDLLGRDPSDGREHNLFSWFTLLARDPSTGRLAFLFDAECS